MGKKHPTVCELCGREGVQTTLHHLTPREEGGTFLPTAYLCMPCHQQIHALFTNKELVLLGLTTVEALRQHEKMKKYLKWIRKQPSSKVPRTKTAKGKKHR
ncbi:HNH endonuclease [Anoxybacteroides tepidamans]|uniref:HNH endonuclease n=1 Tax=Anoxybacteroides tepidamans TaxID=265948 RepID=UPI0004885450|nr:HNH endonuclease [Anoxybacillus tepidamans]